jgi:transcriptional regulator with XRE-family HTH domain
MSRESKSVSLLPEQVRRSLVNLGESLAIARVRRKQSQRDWASRIGVSIPTLIKMERGDPSVGMSVYATALWMMGKSSELGTLAAPESDLGAIELDVRAAIKRRSVRKEISFEANLTKNAILNKKKSELETSIQLDSDE